jgi:GTP-binding protein
VPVTQIYLFNYISTVFNDLERILKGCIIHNILKTWGNMFDRAEIGARSGVGGSGSISFRREKFVPFGGPDGGDGGNGGNIVIRADEATESLRRYRQKRTYRAEHGGNGSGNRKHGKSGEDMVLPVPLGTIVGKIVEDGSNEFIADLEKPGDEVVVARGGKGGWGNTHYVSSTNQAPHIAQRGEEGEECRISLEMRLIADVGIIGYPNAGKSTLLAAASAAKPKIDSYPFTTIEPALGVVEVGQDIFVMAEIPGLIEGAHLGKGLGHDFLRHAMRTKILIHLVSGSSETPVEDMMRVNAELTMFDPSLAQKPQIIALNKIDLPEVKSRLKDIKQILTGAGVKAHYISAVAGEGVAELMKDAMNLLSATTAGEKRKTIPAKVFRPKPREAPVSVSKHDGEYVVSAPELERVIAGAGASPAEIRWQLNRQLKKLGVNKELEKAGVKPGDKIRCGEMEWEW